MAYTRDFAVTEVVTASTNPEAQVEFPVHQTNDILLMMLAVDGVNIPALPSGWTDIQNQAGAAQAFRLCYKVAASSSEVCPALSLSATDEWHIIVLAVAGADFADPINFSAERTATDAAAPFTWTSSASTDETNVLIFQFCNSDSGLALTCTTMGYTNLVNGDAGTAGVSCAYTFQPASGAITDATWTGRANDDTTACAVGINDDGNGTRPAYADPTTSGSYVSALGGTSLIESDTNPATLAFGAIGMQDFDQFWAFDGTATYTDDTTDVNDVDAADVTITNAVGAIWYFGYDYRFNHMVLQRSTASTGGTIVWEYWNGGSWATLTMTGALTATGWVRMTWVTPTDWATTTVNSSPSRYWVRMRVSATFTVAPVSSRGHVGGWLTTLDSVANAADAGVNPYMDVMSLTPASTSNFSGPERQFGSAKALNNGILIIHHKSQLARDYAVDASRNDVVYPVTEIGLPNKNGTVSGYGGFLCVLADASSNYEAYAIHSKQTETGDYNAYNVAAIGINNGARPYGTIGALNKSAVTRMLLLPQGQYGAMLAYVSSMLMVSEIVFAGGDSTNPINVGAIRRVANNCIGSSYLFLGAGDFNRVYAPIQFGGNNQIKTNIDGAIFQFPTAYNGAEYLDWNANDNVAGVEFYGTSSSDELKFPNCVWKGSQPFRWEFNSSHSASTVLDFTGNTVNGATVTLRSTVTLSDITFSNCDITLNGADISGSTIKNKRSSATGGLVFTSVTEGNGIIISTFSNNNDGDLGHSIRITATGTYTFNGHTFTGGGPSHFAFLTQTDVDPATDVITETGHGYSTGDAVYYQDQGGTPDIGLTDGTLYYVRAVTANTLAFYATKANALADTSRIALTDGATEQTHYIYSAKADVFVDVAGTTTINITNGGEVPTIRARDGAIVNVILSVAVTLTVLDDSNDPIQNVQVYFQKSATGKNWNYTSDSGNNAGDADFIVNETVDLDIPQTGWLHVWDASANTKQNYRYASWSVRTFTLPTEVTGSATSAGTSTTLNSTGIGALNIQEGDTIRNTTDGSWAVVDELSTNSATTSELQGGTDNTWQNSDNFSVHRLAVNYADNDDQVDIPILNGQTDVNGQISTTYNYSAYNTNLPILIRVRSNQGVTKYIPYNTSGTITSSGFTSTVILTQDTVAT